MANTIIKFPDERTEGKDIVTAYHEINGTDYIVFKTDKVDNGNEVVGVSYKPASEERFQKIVDFEEWKKAKGILVDDIKGKQDNFTYVKVEGETLVTEDYIHDLALREANKDALEQHYQEFLKHQEIEVSEVQQNAQALQNPEPTVITQVDTPSQAPVINEVPPVATPQVLDTPVNIPPVEPAVLASEPPVATPIIEESNVVPFPAVENASTVAPTPEPVVAPTEPTIAPIVNETPQVFESPVISPMETPAETAVKTGESVVTESYVTKAHQLIEDFKTIADKFTKNMEELAQEMGRQLEEAHHINELSKQTFDNAQQILNSQSSETLTRDLNKVA